MAPLPAKQNGIFKKILKCYDYKQYKMGLKLAKQILSNPETADHGETLAMKGLILNCMGKKDEAFEYVRRGLKNDLRSHVCWHVYGLLQRSEHKYDEAIKCYRNALKHDKDNITILRDLSLLQIQMRDLEGFRDTRYQLFMLRPAQRVSWLGFATSYHLLKNHELAIKILDEFRKSQQANNQSGASQSGENTSTSPQVPIDYEQSELLLYQISILIEAQNYKEALDYLNKFSANQICDRLAVLEYRAQLLMALNRKTEAATILRYQLIARNHENYQYYQQLEQALDLNPSDENSRLAVYQEIQRQYPRSQVPFKLPLTFVNEPELFRPLVDAYLKKCIRKGLPALFRNMKTIYNLEYDKLVAFVKQTQTISANIRSRKKVFDEHGLPTKIKIIEELMQKYEKNLETSNNFEGDSATREDTTCVLWCYYYLAQHFDYLEMYDQALNYVTKAMDHTPTLIELLTIKAKIYKHKQEPEKAVEFVNEAQRLDTADRYLNSKCAKYLLRANKINQAEEMCSKFTRVGVPVTENLNEMQCMWFQIECALAYQRQKKYGEALKKCYSIDAYFAEVNEDQFDFHTYCMRKMTLRSYVKLLRLEDVLKSHRFFFNAAEIAIKIYLQLHDHPLVDEVEVGKKEQLSASELKKIKNKQRKAEAKKKQHQTTPTTETPENNLQSEANLEKMDAHALERPKDPLEMALRFLRPLKTLASNKIDTHLLAFEIYRRQDKLMLMLQSIKRAIKLDPYHDILQKQLVSFSQYVESRVKPLLEPIKKVLELEMPAIRDHIIVRTK